MTPPKLSLKLILTSKPVLFLEMVILLFFAFSVAKEIMKKRAIEREIGRLEADIGRLQNDKDKLSALFSYAQTDAFVEQEAREKLNLAKEGENLLLLPKADAASGTAGVEAASAAYMEPDLSEPAGPPPSNAKLWWRYFFERERLWED